MAFLCSFCAQNLDLSHQALVLVSDNSSAELFANDKTKLPQGKETAWDILVVLLHRETRG
jgi:hypothetical protein